MEAHSDPATTGPAATVVADVEPYRPSPTHESVGDGGTHDELGVLPRLPLGLAILVAERLRMGDRPGPRAVGAGGAFLVGFADAAAVVTEQATRALLRASRRPAGSAFDIARSGLRRPPLRLIAGPANRLRTAIAVRVAETVARGRTVATLARAEAVVFLDAESASGVAWVRQQVMPTMIDELAADPKIRELAVTQTRGVFADAARELRQRSASADGRLEAGVQRLLGRQAPAPSARPQPADG